MNSDRLNPMPTRHRSLVALRIVPQSRLLFWFGVVVLPYSVLGALYPEAFLFSAALIAGLITLALLDAALAQGNLDGIRLELPEVVRASKDRPTSIPVKLQNERQRARRLRLGLGLPREIRSPNEELQVLLPQGAEFSRLDWPCEPLRRGNYRVAKAYLETPSRLGFWALRGTVSAPCEIRVYPNLLMERKKLAALFLHRGAFGLHAQRQVGKGRDFEKLRDYISGDGYDEIHWKATAKRGRPVTKVFQIERTQEVYAVIDASRLSARNLCVVRRAWPVVGRDAAAAVSPEVEPGTTDGAEATTVLERFLTSALLLGQAAEHQGDFFGLITFTDRVQTFLRAKNGQAHYSACRDALYTLEPQTITPDFDEISAFIRTRLRRRALLIFLTSLEDPVLAENFVRNMSLLAGQHLVLVNMLKPPGADPLFAGLGVESLDDLYQRLGGHLQWHGLRELEKVLQRRGVRFSLLENERLASELVSQYLGVKQRQLL